MKKILVISLAALAALVSCQKANFLNEPSIGEGTVTFSAIIADSDTKTTIDYNDSGAKIFWELNDQITITDVSTSNTGVYKVTAGQGTKNAIFSYVSGEEFDGTSTYTAVFGTTPEAVQTYSSMNPTHADIYMTSSTPSAKDALSFTTQCGVLKLSLTSAGKSITKVEISDGTNMYALNMNSAVDISSEQVFYWSLPAGNYTRMCIYDNAGNLANKALSPALTITAGHLKPASTSTLSFDAIVPAAVVNLSASATANTYMVHSAGRYAFRAVVKGNGGLDPLTGKMATIIDPSQIAGVKVLWELYDQGRAIKHDGTNYEISYSDGYVYFTTPDTFVEGDICVAVYDSSDNILWSWLIWATNDPGTIIHNTKTFMNRNLGAIDVGNCMRGFLYQWGRKDAYSAANGGYNVYPYYPSASIAFNYVSGDKTMAYTVTNPTSWVRVSGSNNSWMVQSEYSTKPWRADIKTIYDPCPIGWRVPTKENLSGFPGFPATGIYGGYDDGYYHGFGNPGTGYCWSASSDEGDDNRAYAFVNDGRNIQHWSQGEGYAIRPVMVSD